eukprot:TRINITY_DN4096_c0_g1_i1.p1 TRINITY_DN4096_c0_g1~~TRINITY_DN4096_c0_g1_i1.p1  ORF type:complete len:142 (-),score=42.17 TRINITY_DN4096_c0_g1_i1:48-473(-)
MGKTDKRILYVGGLDEQVTDAILKAAFIPFGDIVDVQIPLDHVTESNRGFGFVEYELMEDAAAAMDNMNFSELYGKVLKVNFARPMKSYFKPVWSKDEYFEDGDNSGGENNGDASTASTLGQDAVADAKMSEASEVKKESD